MTRPRATLAMRTLRRCTVLARFGLARFGLAGFGLAGFGLAGFGLAALGMGALSPAAAATAEDSSATVRLIQLLIEKGVLTQGQAASLLKQAQDESKAKPRPAKPAPVTAAANAAPAAANAATAPVAEPPATPPGSVRVTYVPQIVRDQIAGEVRQQVMQQAQTEGWAAPNALPEWTKRIHVYGDVRMRDQQNLENKANAPLTDFNSINSSAGGFDTTTGGLPPTLNSNQNRTYFQMRARLGVAAEINDWASTDFSLATGNDNSPVSTNQTLGASGDFSKYAIWLDRAAITLTPYKSLTMVVGRAPNPFWTSELEYWEDLNFDGVSISDTVPLNGALDVFATAGAFSVFNTALNFSSLNTPKFPSHDKYLFAAQGGAVARPAADVSAKLAAGFFAYTNIDGKPSAPCDVIQTNFGCSTDASRAQFVQNGNTLFGIRNILQTGTSSATPQYFGLASRFDIFDLHGQVGYTGLRVPLVLEGEFSKNFGFNRSLIASRAPVTNLDANGTFRGGDTAYMMQLKVGKALVSERWDWNATVGYKYLESDSVLDALTDPNFHLGGTNAKGFYFGANLGLGHNLWLDAHWYSSTQVSGLPYANDVIQFDLNARF